MGKKNKLTKFAEVTSFKNCFEYNKEISGKWNQDYFPKANKITVELACGKGEYTIGLAERNPERNFIGVDVKGNRIWKGAQYALDQDLQNVAFHRMQIGNITEYFGEEEVDEFWITFPDPQPRKGKAKKRLTHPNFLAKYRHISKPDAVLNLKTDDTGFYEFTKEVIEEEGLELLLDSDDVYAWDEAPEELLNIQTFYEKMWLDEGKKIKYLRFKLHK
ncbi:tRNA (guanosine(46)-N7)-methyltransferase TrmB [bacterium]|nr:tRNA (guanosine(46)-N7)-methyltransferase TrmB [bacterium]